MSFSIENYLKKHLTLIRERMSYILILIWFVLFGQLGGLETIPVISN